MGREERDARHESVLTALPSTYNRRIGRRVSVDPSAALSWLPSVPAKRFGRRRKPQRGSLVDLSLTGARIKAPADPAIVAGTLVVIAVDDLRGVVKVRRIDAAIDPAVSLYGVEFIRLDARLQDLMDRTLSVHRPDETCWRWNHAR